MDDSFALARAVIFGTAGYPIYLARTLIQLGYEPAKADQHGRLPNIFSYIAIIRDQRGYLSLFTGLRYHLPFIIIERTSFDLMASVTSHKKDKLHGDVSEIIAVCMRESAIRIQTTLITYPLFTLGVGYISSAFFGTKETVEYTIEALYKGVVPKLIIEVTMVWVNIISRRLTVGLVEDETLQVIVSRILPFVVQSFLYPFNVVSTVMADNGRSGFNPKFDDWRQCFKYLGESKQLKRGASFFYRNDYRLVGGHSIKRYF